MVGCLVRHVLQEVCRLEMAARARYCEESSTKRCTNIQNRRIPALG